MVQLHISLAAIVAKHSWYAQIFTLTLGVFSRAITLGVILDVHKIIGLHYYLFA